MKATWPWLVVCSALLVSTAPAAVTHYVNAGGTHPLSPYLTWADAATNIQDAINRSGTGDTILVTNGIYQSGSFSVGGANNRIYTLFNHLTIQSVNGPAVTTIVGYQVPGTTNGSAAVRCAYLVDNAVLSGFTLTNGATPISGQGGGVLCASTNCLVTNCVIINNAAYTGGGGAGSGTLVNCLLAGNVLPTLNIGNGGGAYYSTLINCVLTRNFSAYIGGAAGFCTLINCTVVSNSAAAYAGSLYTCTAKNTIVYYNSSYYTGADISSGQYFTNCCLSFPTNGGGVFGANNFTNPPAFVNAAAGDFHLNPGSPGLDAGDSSLVAGNTDLAGNPRIVGAGVDLGAYENQIAGGVHYVNLNNNNPVTPYTNWLTAATNIQDAVDAAVAGEFVVVSNGTYVTGGRVVFGTMTNRVTVDRAVTVQSVYGPAAAVISGLPFTGSYYSTGVRCAYLTNGAVLTGFTLTNGATRGSGTDLVKEQSGAAVWCESTAATISNCVLAHCYANANGGGAYSGTLTHCLVTNTTAFLSGGGTYLANLYDCQVVSNRLIQGSGGGGAAYGTLSNCLVTWNYAPGSGGGTYYSTLSHCVLSNNVALNSGGGTAFGAVNDSLITSNLATLGGGSYSNVLSRCILSANYGAKLGGGTYLSSLTNCLVLNNRAGSDSGGGIYGGTLINCTVVSNSVGGSGGGIASAIASNCIVYFNTNYLSGVNPNYIGSTLNYCCTTPLPAAGSGNFTNPPAFVSAVAGDFHLQNNSPCINAGNNAAVSGATDLDGLARLSGGTVDAGAYEFQNPASLISYAWLLKYNLPVDGTADSQDADGDGMNNYAEWRTGTNPQDNTSLLRVVSAASNGGSGLTVTWQSVSGVTYFIQRGVDLGASPVFTTLQSGIAGQPGTTSYSDPTATGGNAWFYRVGVQ